MCTEREDNVRTFLLMVVGVIAGVENKPLKSAHAIV